MSQTQNLPLNNERHPLYFEHEIEVRSAETVGAPIRIFGYSALFNVRSREMRTSSGKRFVEVILPGAFDTVNDTDCDCRYDHHVFLASKGNYRTGVDARGRWYEYDHDPNDPDHQSVLAKIRRGECKGSSFMFDEPDVTDQEVEREGPILVRKIKRFARLWDEGPVRKPAYRQTSVSVRSIEEFSETDLAEPASAAAEQRDMSGAYDANTNPTPAQKEAGNYKKGKVRVHGMEISIENPIGSVRSGTSADGTPWENEMRAHYGYILGASAADGDNLDVFLTDDAETARMAWVIDQINPDGTFDEHKVLIGPASEEDARALYLSHYPEGWQGLGAICCVPMPCFVAWAMDGKAKKQPLMHSGRRGFCCGTEVKAGGTGAEEQRNEGGTPAELGGNAVETARNSSGTPVEQRGNKTEEQRNAAEQLQLLERRKRQVRATLIG